MTDKLEFHCPRYTYPGSTAPALKDVTFSLNRGECLKITGSSGCGKTTLLKILALHMPMSEGRYQFYNGQQLSNPTEHISELYRLNKIAYMPQSSPMVPYLSTVDNVMRPLRYQGLSKKEAENIVYPLLDELDLKSVSNQYPNTLSGGQRQRAAFIRSIATQPELLLADEPTSALDPLNTQRLLNILHRFTAAGGTTILVSHDQCLSKWGTSSLICV